MIQYKILTGTTPNELAEQVEKSISEYWLPQGGVTVAMAHHGGFLDLTYAQAMVQTPPEPVYIHAGNINKPAGMLKLHPHTTALIERLKEAKPGVILSEAERELVDGKA